MLHGSGSCDMGASRPAVPASLGCSGRGRATWERLTQEPFCTNVSVRHRSAPRAAGSVAVPGLPGNTRAIRSMFL